VTSLRGVRSHLERGRLTTCHSEVVRLLVVEDEAGMAAALAKGLGAEGFVVDVEGTGPGGLEAARFGGYDAVLLDIMLPGMSGYTVVKTLREEGNWVPVLMLSAKDGEYDQADGLDYGADDYLTKPFSYVVLLARLRALLRRTPAVRPSVLSAGDVRLDPASREVTVGDEPVSLTPREYGLLEYLLRRPGRVVTKVEILDHVWDQAADVNPNAVEVYVGYLRRKIDVPFERQSLQTVRGAGYRLTPGTIPDTDAVSTP
jgi:two-component system, OmpR family, response regulator